MNDPTDIAACIGAFAWRDQARWADLRSLFTADATLHVSWYAGPVDGFIDASRRMSADHGAQTQHRLGCPRIRVCGDKALAETDVTILIRSRVAWIDVDVTSYARFFDRLERNTDGRWQVAARTAIYEKDRIDPVGPSLLFWLIQSVARYGRYPAPLKHLAYGLERKGLPLVDGLVMSGSDEEAQLKAAAQAWAGGGTPESGLMLP